MTVSKFFLILLLLVVPKDAAHLQENRLRRQFSGNLNPSVSSDNLPQAGVIPINVQECNEEPKIAHARVRCGYSGCRVMCDVDYKLPTGLGFTTLQCDRSSGVLTSDGKPWNTQNINCFPFCGVDGCFHGGRCVQPRTCECVDGYTGKNCEVAPENNPAPLPQPPGDTNTCPEPDFPVVNAEVTRAGQQLLVRCAQGHVFKIGGTIAFIQCRDGAWDHPQGIFASGGALVCEETQCSPPCQNGGTCLPEGVCDCPYKYWGTSCQHLRCAYPDPAALGKASLGGVHFRMKIECHPRHKMSSGRVSQTILCRKGEWYVSGRGFLKDTDVKCLPVDQMPSGP